jgi:Arc/MetJ family transcription regulator
MGLLDELEQEAERQRALQTQLAVERESREQHWNEQLLPAMRRLDDYLQRLTRNLAYLKKRARTVYGLPGYGDVVATIEPNFVLQSAPATSSYDITLEGLATVVSDECPVVLCDNPGRVRSVSAVLHQHHLTGISDARKDANGEVQSARFQAKGRIPLHMAAHADVDSGQLRIVFQNFEGLGSSSRTFAADDLDDALFDALARFITREETTFAQEAVGDEVRRQLKSRIQRDQMKRQWEDKLSRQLDEDEAKVIASLDPSLRPGGLLGRLRLISRRLIGR